ncbi:MAG: RNA degradosome polyphosphate kinase, partial [Lachnospiraceae bacterium]|nr:RNA degradosome polyphosphate kinase [Lachnospiraceae bacterium]
VEILFPVEEENLKERIVHILDVLLADNVKARILNPDGTYTKVDKRGKVRCLAHERFCLEADEENRQEKEPKKRVFIPEEPAD